MVCCGVWHQSPVGFQGRASMDWFGPVPRTLDHIGLGGVLEARLTQLTRDG